MCIVHEATLLDLRQDDRLPGAKLKEPLAAALTVVSRVIREPFLEGKHKQVLLTRQRPVPAEALKTCWLER